MAFEWLPKAPGNTNSGRNASGHRRRPPEDALSKKGRDVFQSATCAMCHAIVGTEAQGRSAPDLTHLASRRTIGAGMFPNLKGHLAGWVVDAQALKPGVLMPPNPLPPDDEQALLAYLGSLK
jgi:cytochrome c oxidase subunit 2